MVRPTTKQEMVEAANASYFKLMHVIDAMPVPVLNAPFTFKVEKEKGAH